MTNPTQTPANVFHGEGERILVVDDDPAILEILGAGLRTMGFEVTALPDAAAALPILRQPDAVDLLILDCIMPGMSGATLLRTLSAEGIEIPVLLISGVNEDQLRLDPQLRDLPFLAKPFLFLHLSRALSQLLERESCCGTKPV